MTAGARTVAMDSQIDVKEHIKSLSKRLIQAINNRTWRETAELLMLPSFSGYHDMDDNPWSVNNREAINNYMEDFLTEHPDFYTEILDMSVELDEKRGTASVWVLRSDINLTDKPRSETYMELAWVRKGEDWYCCGYQGVKSFPFYASDDHGGGGL